MPMWWRRKRSSTQVDIEAVRRDWANELRVTSGPNLGAVVIAVRAEGGEWAEVEVCTGDVDSLIRLLVDARDAAQQTLDAVALVDPRLR